MAGQDYSNEIRIGEQRTRGVAKFKISRRWKEAAKLTQQGNSRTVARQYATSEAVQAWYGSDHMQSSR